MTDHINKSYQQTIKKKERRKGGYPRLCEPEAREASEFSTCAFKCNELSCTKVSPRLRAIVPADNLRYIRRGKFVLTEFTVYR